MSISISVNSNDFETIIDEWLDNESDLNTDDNDIVRVHSTDSEISDKDANSDDGDSNDKHGEQGRHFFMEKIYSNSHKTHFIVVILELYNTI